MKLCFIQRFKLLTLTCALGFLSGNAQILTSGLTVSGDTENTHAYLSYNKSDTQEYLQESQSDSRVGLRVRLPAFQNLPNENQVKAVFIYNFTKYIDWKPSPNNQFVILIIGSSPIEPSLREIARNNKVKNMKMAIMRSSSLDNISSCNIVFVPESEQDKLPAVLSKTANSNILVISEAEGASQKGSDINFVSEDNKVKFEINNNSLKRHGLQASSQLLKLAVTVFE